MKTIKTLIILVTFFNLSGFAQQSEVGSLETIAGKSINIKYIKSSEELGDTLFKTHYSIRNSSNELLFELVLKHNLVKRIISVQCFDAIKKATTPFSNVAYSNSGAGLIFNNQGNLDREIDASKKYNYLFFFSDTTRRFINMNLFTTFDGSILQLDKVPQVIKEAHNNIVNVFIKNPLVANMIFQQELIYGKQLNRVEKLASDLESKYLNLKESRKNVIEDLIWCKNTNISSSDQYNSLTNKVYELEYFSNAYQTINKGTWQTLAENRISTYCGECYYENNDINFVIKIVTDTVGNVTGTDLVYPLTVNSLGAKDYYLFVSICDMIKQVTFPTNKINVYGKTYSVKTTMNVDLYVSIKNKKEKIIYTDKNNMVYKDTKFPLSADMKMQVNSKMFSGAKSGVYSIKVCSFTVNKKEKETITEMNFK